MFLIIICLSFKTHNLHGQPDTIVLDSKYDDFFTRHNLNIAEILNFSLYEEAVKWLYTRYKYGSSSATGIDCSGLVRIIFEKAFGIILPRTSREIFAQCEPVHEADELREGDLVFFKIYKGVISHVGIYLQNGKFLHAARHGGVRIDSLSHPYYRRFFYKAGRLKD
ncbi:MAG: C40 family peptidase [Chitinophagales bacterium]|nr:C40 family peptidase [Chitinophagales bacterium]MDW8273851.1 C40 family peptidase [Chitinophagales bacterium]